MHRNDLFMLLACAAVLAAMAGNPPMLPGKHMTFASLWPHDAPSAVPPFEPSTLQP